MRQPSFSFSFLPQPLAHLSSSPKPATNLSLLTKTYDSHSRTQLPKYAVPVFIRIVQEMTPIHNNKQNKVPLREEGVDPAKVKHGDRVLWIEKKGKGDSYVDFQPDDWESLSAGKAQL